MAKATSGSFRVLEPPEVAAARQLRVGPRLGCARVTRQQTVLRTNREAKPIQTVRATYPAMALRAGLESDVTLRMKSTRKAK